MVRRPGQDIAEYADLKLETSVRHSCCETRNAGPPTVWERVCTWPHHPAMVATIPRGGLSVGAPCSACSVRVRRGRNAPLAGQSPASAACSLSLQPVLAEQRRPPGARFYFPGCATTLLPCRLANN